MYKIAIVGPGTMGKLLQTILQTENTVTMVGREQFTKTSWADFDVICLAIKPQVFQTMTSIPAPHALIISVMAGITMNTISRITTSQRIIRTMPNTPIKVNAGMTAWCKTESVTPADVTWFETQFASATTLLNVSDDDGINKATAVSGSGPGFIFATIEAYTKAAVELGLTTDQAQVLVQQTFIGAIELLKQSNLEAATLRQQVTSAGGTTAAGLAQLDAAQWSKVFAAAYARAKELSQ